MITTQHREQQHRVEHRAQRAPSHAGGCRRSPSGARAPRRGARTVRSPHRGAVDLGRVGKSAKPLASVWPSMTFERIRHDAADAGVVRLLGYGEQGLERQRGLHQRRKLARHGRQVAGFSPRWGLHANRRVARVVSFSSTLADGHRQQSLLAQELAHVAGRSPSRTPLRSRGGIYRGVPRACIPSVLARGTSCLLDGCDARRAPWRLLWMPACACRPCPESVGTRRRGRCAHGAVEVISS